MADRSFLSGNGYFWLDAWVLANVIQLGTQKFCLRFLKPRIDPCGRLFDQMTQAARSGAARYRSSPRARSAGLSSAGRMRSSIRREVFLPPLP